ncbi:hypothetical protein QTV49_000463 [Vibrio vulnificus]|nr:hypothetical protein [Vibrio vulnificus]
MTTTTNKKHPIARLLNSIMVVAALSLLIFGAIELFASLWCETASYGGLGKDSSWRVKACAKYYWDVNSENPNGW